MGAPTLGLLATLRHGFAGAWPDDADPRALRALRLVRVSAYALPLACVLGAFGLLSVAESASDTLEGFMDPALILFTLGLVVLLAIPLMVMIALAQAMAALLLALALPLALLQAWALGRLMDPGEPPADAPMRALAAVGILSLAVSLALVLSLVGILVAPLTLLPFLGWWRLRRAMRALDEAPDGVAA